MNDEAHCPLCLTISLGQHDEVGHKLDQWYRTQETNGEPGDGSLAWEDMIWQLAREHPSAVESENEEEEEHQQCHLPEEHDPDAGKFIPPSPLVACALCTGREVSGPHRTAECPDNVDTGNFPAAVPEPLCLQRLNLCATDQELWYTRTDSTELHGLPHGRASATMATAPPCSSFAQ